MPYEERNVVVKALVWVPFQRPELPSRPGGLPPGWGIPEYPEGPWEPGRPEHPWVPDEPGVGGGPVLPGRPTLPPDFEWPERPEWPGYPTYPVVDPGEIGGHPEAEELDLNATRRIAVSDGDNVFPAYVVTGGESEEPRHPEKGLPGSWVTVAYHGHVAWAWSPTLTLPPRPEMPERPGQGLPRPPRPERP